MRVADVVKFNRENYYNGAVQTEWFYDAEKVKGISQSYVFHGPKYYGVSSNDVTTKEHKLIDTASFAKVISKKLFSQKADNNFVLTIAGYGTGKSHLAVTLGALFSGNENLQNGVIRSIEAVDKTIAADISANVGRKNLVIALNGMKNFNLDAEVLKSVRLALEQNGIDDGILKSLTKTYDVAKYFINENFENCCVLFESAAEGVGIGKQGEELKSYLLDKIESDSKAIDIVNTVFMKITGDSLHWEQGVSAGDVILKISSELCGEGKPFNKVLVLFDEFGRYIEYVAANPTIAGDASLQQIFEAIQSSGNRAIFIGFIQYELEAYLAHIDKSANVIRYVGRYSASEKYYLSSNFETILANLLEKDSSGKFEKKVCPALTRYANFHNKMHSALERWNGTKVQKNVWKSDDLYRSVIMEGCYPLHPITVWLLSNSSGWMQQRSTIAFCAEMYENVQEDEIEGEWLPYVYPVDIINSGIYSEMLNSEEKGLVKSQNCMLYNEICVKIGDKLTVEESQVLKAVLISKIGGFRFYDKEDAYVAFRYCTNLKEEEIRPAVKNLEDRHGVIAYDDQAKTYDLIAEANGFNEFKRVFARYRTGNTAAIEDMGENVLSDLGLNEPIETAFGQDNAISSSEWKFEKRLVESSEIDDSYVERTLREVDVAYDGESCRGVLLYAYCSEDSDEEVKRLSEMYKLKGLEKAPIIILFLDDSDGEIVRALTIINTLQKFSIADAERFSKHILAQKRSQSKKMVQTFNSLVMSRAQITEDGLCHYEGRLNALCTSKFATTYTKPVPFQFDGFGSSKASQAKKTFATICVKMFDHTLMNIQSYQALNTADKNRVQACLAVGSPNSWQVFGNTCQLVLPQNELIKRIYNEVDSAIPDEGSYSVNRLFGKYLHSPYGMNIYSYTLFVIYFIQKHENKLICYLGNEKLTAANLNNSILKDGKLKFSELQRVLLQRNLNADVDVVAELCNEILDNTDVYRCIAFRRRLVDIVRSEGSNSKNQLLVGQSEMRLDDGDKIREKLEERKAKVKEFLDEATAKFVIHKFVGIFEFLNYQQGIIEEGLPYVYPQSYVDYIDESKQRVRNYMGETFNNTLAALRCSDITQLSSFQNTYSRVVKKLREQGYNNQADSTEARVAQIISETKAKNQYNQALGECEKDVALLSQVSSLSYEECDNVIAKMEGWKTFFADADMPESLSGPLINKVNETLKRVQDRRNEILDLVEKRENLFSSANTLEELLDNKSEVLDLLKYKLPEEIEKRLGNLVKRTEEVVNRIGDLPETIDELIEIVGMIRCQDAFDRVYLSSAEKLKDSLVSSQNDWIDRVIAPIENGQEIDVQQCTSYIEKLHNIPEYVSLSVIRRAQSAEKMVTDRLHECKVQGVLSLFNSLSEDEKEEFIKLITK